MISKELEQHFELLSLLEMEIKSLSHQLERKRSNLLLLEQTEILHCVCQLSTVICL